MPVVSPQGNACLKWRRSPVEAVHLAWGEPRLSEGRRGPGVRAPRVGTWVPSLDPRASWELRTVTGVKNTGVLSP